MAFNHQVTTKTDGLFVSLGNATDGYRLAGLKDVGELAMTGTATQIDTTGYIGTNKTSAQGKLDPGQIQATANAAPHSPLYTFLENAQKDGIEHTFSLVAGSIEGDTGLTEGKPLKVVDGVTVSYTAPSGSAATKVTIAGTQAQNMPGITQGDYINPYNRTAGGTGAPAANYADAREIKNIERSGDDVVLTLEGGALAVANTNRINVVRPGLIMQIQVLVMKVSYRFPVDGVAEAMIEMQATGEGTRTVGSPVVDFDSFNLPSN